MQAGLSLGPVTSPLLAECSYGPTNSPQWIEKLRLRVILVSVARGDRNGRPSTETLEAFKNYTLLRTGWIDLSTDGVQM